MHVASLEFFLSRLMISEAFEKSRDISSQRPVTFLQSLSSPYFVSSLV
jgi:hypothetical protein